MRTRVAGWLLAGVLAGGTLMSAADAQPAPAEPEIPSATRDTNVPAVFVPADRTPLPAPAPARRAEWPQAFTEAVPTSLADLRQIQQQAEKMAAQVSPAVVVVQIGIISGSGVIITTNGIVLTAGHVCGRPNRAVRFIFPDGRVAHGRTLGADLGSDVGLLQITDPGVWPHAEMGDLRQARAGDWVMALGYPGGFDRQRSVVVRLGRIIQIAPEAFQTDCTIAGGDSGGPLIDLRGRVIGIHSFISLDPTENYHVPTTQYHAVWNQLVRGENAGEAARPRAYVGASPVDDAGGCRLAALDVNGPASKAGLKAGDMVRKVDGRNILAAAAFQRWVAEAEPGETLTVEVQRGGKVLTFSVKLMPRPKSG